MRVNEIYFRCETVGGYSVGTFIYQGNFIPQIKREGEGEREREREHTTIVSSVTFQSYSQDS